MVALNRQFSFFHFKRKFSTKSDDPLYVFSNKKNYVRSSLGQYKSSRLKYLKAVSIP